MPIQIAQSATFDEVCKIPTPPSTKTFTAVPHQKLIEVLRLACNKNDIGIKSEAYSLARDGKRLFGSFELEPITAPRGYTLQLGFRQGIDKSMAIGVCAGLSIVVCSNMMFDGEFVEFRKHTSGLTVDRLEELAHGAVAISISKMLAFKKWHASLREAPVSSDQFKMLTYDAMTQGVFAPARLNKFINAYGEERITQGNLGHPVSTLYTWHGGVTRLLRGSSLFNQSDSNQVLQGICNNFILQKQSS